VVIQSPSSGSFERLRREAEVLLEGQPRSTRSKRTDLLELIHELEVHEAELEIQNQELLRTQAQLDRLHREYVDLYESAPCGYLTVDTDRRVTRANQRALDALDIGHMPVVGSPCLSLLEDAVRTQVSEAFAASAASAETQSVVVSTTSADDAKRRWLQFDIRADVDDAGRVGGWRLIITDVTERLVLEEELRRSEKMRAVGQLAGGVAHDFNNQLAGILGFAELLEGRLEDDRLRGFAARIKKAATRSASLTAQLLAFSRKGVSGIMATVDLHSVVSETAALLEMTVDKRIMVRQCLEARPSCTWGDESQIQNVLLNVMLNAVDAMPSGGSLTVSTRSVDREPEIRQRGRVFFGRPGRYVRITVADTGFGMGAETLDRVFEPFFTTKPAGKGLGMGMAAVYGTLERHGGGIEIRSEVGHGTTVEIDFQEQVAPAVVAPPVEIDRSSTASARVLVVDDEVVVRDMLTEMLPGLGHTVVDAVDGVEAMRLVAEDPTSVDLVLLDMVMPDVSGAEVFRAIRQSAPAMPVILCTGFDRNPHVEELLADGANAVIHKPFSLKELDEVIGSTVDDEAAEG
jgi:signal transduction histidine kinase/ActR/RegA family two-component response regulator